jgi:sodium transport system permease protein
LLWISARSTSFKQAQLLYMPALLVGAALAAVSWMPELSLSSVVCLVPISGLSLAIRDLLHEQLSLFWLTLTVLASLASTGLFLYWVVDSLQLDREAPGDDRPSEQMRQQLGQDVLWYFAAAAALMVVLPGNFPSLSGLRGQVALNQGMMLLLSLSLLKFYRQPLASSLRWRNTHWRNWLICLVAAPLVHVCANSVAIVSSWMLPMSEEMVRQMTELLIPEKTSQLELLLLIAASPALCEELAFRGTILHSLQKPADLRRPTWATCLAVGLVFGAFHFSLQRLLPTAVIGVLLTFVALRTGSIWPCMWLHLVNNSLALLLHSQHLDYTQFPAWTWLAAWALLLFLLRGLTQGFPCHSGEHAEVEKTVEA